MEAKVLGFKGGADVVGWEGFCQSSPSKSSMLAVVGYRRAVVSITTSIGRKLGWEYVKRNIDCWRYMELTSVLAGMRSRAEPLMVT